MFLLLLLLLLPKKKDADHSSSSTSAPCSTPGSECFPRRRQLSCGAFSLVFANEQLEIRFGNDDVWAANSQRANSVTFSTDGILTLGNVASTHPSRDRKSPFALTLSPTGFLTITDANFKLVWRGVKYVAPPPKLALYRYTRLSVVLFKWSIRFMYFLPWLFLSQRVVKVPVPPDPPLLLVKYNTGGAAKSLATTGGLHTFWKFRAYVPKNTAGWNTVCCYGQPSIWNLVKATVVQVRDISKDKNCLSGYRGVHQVWKNSDSSSSVWAPEPVNQCWVTSFRLPIALRHWTTFAVFVKTFALQLMPDGARILQAPCSYSGLTSTRSRILQP